jgi:hypothetical protein
MINLSPSQIGGIATLMVAFEITNQAETQRIINQLNQITRLNGTTVNINLRTKSDGAAIKSLIKPTIPDTSISQALAIADAAVSPHYTSSPKNRPWRQRIEAVKPKMRQIVKDEFRKQKGGIITSRKQYMSAASSSLRGTMRGDIYTAWVNMVTK